MQFKLGYWYEFIFKDGTKQKSRFIGGPEPSFDPKIPQNPQEIEDIIELGENPN